MANSALAAAALGAEWRGTFTGPIKGGGEERARDVGAGEEDFKTGRGLEALLQSQQKVRSTLAHVYACFHATPGGVEGALMLLTEMALLQAETGLALW